jgi:hypothetical protein
MHQRIETEVFGLNVKGTLIVGDWYGDKSIPNGTVNLDPYVEDMCVEANGYEITAYLTDDAIIEIEERIIEEWGSRDK